MKDVSSFLNKDRAGQDRVSVVGLLWFVVVYPGRSGHQVRMGEELEHLLSQSQY